VLQLLGEHRSSACLLDQVSIAAILLSLRDACLARFAGEVEMLTRGTFLLAEDFRLKVKAPVA
jgi:hypothetical protein